MRIPIGKYGKGHIPDPPDSRDHRFGADLTSVPDSVDQTRYVDAIRNQNQTSRCVAAAIARACHMLAQIEGASKPLYPAELAIYAMARVMEQVGVPADVLGTECLGDNGSQPRLAMKSLQDWGICPERVWMPDDSKINVVPTLDVLEASAGYRLSEYVRIISTGDEKVSDIQKAMAAGSTVVFAMNVDRSFEDLKKGSVYAGPSGPSLGGHMMALGGYWPNKMLTINSWGPDWAEDGFGWLSNAFMGSGYVTDTYALKVVPIL